MLGIVVFLKYLLNLKDVGSNAITIIIQYYNNLYGAGIISSLGIHTFGWGLYKKSDQLPQPRAENNFTFNCKNMSFRKCKLTIYNRSN